MNATLSNWPEKPYRGLDFYRETDAALFRERDTDANACTDLLLGFGVKLLLLQGSSGCGKSSFLRAGLIPALKASAGRRPCIFLNGTDVVVRCTDNPLKEIARFIIGALEKDQSFVRHQHLDESSYPVIDDGVRKELIVDLHALLDAQPEALGDGLIGALIELAGELPGPLILILDQAEEALTRIAVSETSRVVTSAFFRFLENIYIRNIDARIIVSLRTEYYGLFRDQLRISDDRMADRPKSGGVQSYLLRPLRDKDSLTRIILAPTLAGRDDGVSIYDFSYSEGLVSQIIDDLLNYFTYSSVTPALQVVCATLFDGLNDPDRRLKGNRRIITREDYRKSGDIEGILSTYVERGIRAIGATTRAEIDKWRMLLYSLVSRQGGGTVVSLAEDIQELERRARDDNKIEGNIRDSLLKLAVGSGPLLRAEPPDNPARLSLKHDVLAVVLSRWHDEYGGIVKARQEAATRIKYGSFGAALLFAISVLGLFIWQGKITFKEKARLIELRGDRATDEHYDFRLALLLTLANLNATEHPENWFGTITGETQSIRERLTDQLRDILLRSPVYAGNYGSAALDPERPLIALLGRTSIETISLDGDAPITRQRISQEISLSPTTVGFIRGLGLASYSDGVISSWSADGLHREFNLKSRLGGDPTTLLPPLRPTARFIDGNLFLFRTEGRRITAVRVTAADLSSNDKFSEMPLTAASRFPVFASYLDGVYGFIDTPKADILSIKDTPTTIVVRNLREAGFQRELSGNSEGGGNSDIRPRAAQTLAFAANAAAVVVKIDDRHFSAISFDPAHLEQPSSPQPLSFDGDAPSMPFFSSDTFPPFAAARTGQHWRLAWPTLEGVLVAESRDVDPQHLLQAEGGRLIARALPSSVLEFSADGNFLLLHDEVAFSPFSPFFSTASIWDLRKRRREWLKNADLDALSREACRIVGVSSTSTPFSKTEEASFMIDSRERTPCPQNEKEMP